MRQVVIDSSVLIDAVVYVRPKALERIISLYEAFIPVNALEETLFKTIIGVVGGSIKKDNLFEIKRLGLKELEEKRLKTDLM